MPVYHSSFNEKKDQFQSCCNTCIFPLKTKVKGPAPPAKTGEEDIIDETIKFFRANVLFRTFDSQGPGDLTQCYLTIYIGEIIREVQKYKTKADALKNILTVSTSGNFKIPGEDGFCLPGFFTPPKAKAEADLFRAYYRQLREESANRLIEILFTNEGPNKWWFQFSKRKFMNIAKT